MKTKLHLKIILVLFLSSLYIPMRGADNTCQLLGELSVSDSSGWNVFSLDESARRLYAVSASNVFVVDLNKGQVISQFTNVAGVHAFTAMPRFHRFLYLKDQEPKLNFANFDTFKPLSSMKTGSRPEAIFIEPNAGMGYVLNAGDHTVTTFEPDDGDIVATIPLPGIPRTAVFDSRSRRIFFTIEDQNQIAVLSPGGKKDVNAWAVAPGEKPVALVSEPQMQRVLVGCGNNKLVMMDVMKGKVVDSVDIEAGAGTLAYDPVRKRVFALGNKGIVTIVQLYSPQKLMVVGTLNVPNGSSGMAVDSKRSKLYVGTSDAKILVYGE